MADALDEGVAQDVVLLKLSEALAAVDIDVTSNLNSRDVVRQRIRRARLGRFPDLPSNTLATSTEIESWESAYSAAQIGGIAIIADENTAAAPVGDFLQRWLSSNAEQRVFVSFHGDDLEAAKNISRIASAYGYGVEFHFAGDETSDVGQHYATAAQRLAIDSRAARRYRSSITEFEYLGERVRRRSNSLFTGDRFSSLARSEPSVFEKETLGDEFNQSTISEIVVPGGVALGETADLDFAPEELLFDGERLIVLAADGERLSLPEIALADAKALFDFVTRSTEIESDAIVDIDGDSRVRISSALRDTDAGFAILHADTQPFEYVRNLRVTKSVVIDTGVEWRKTGIDEPLRFSADFEVRFLSADNMRIAQTRAALEYGYDSELKTVEYSDGWGRDAGRLDENLDYAGLGQSMLEVAAYAGWAGLFRRLQEDEIPFLRGRYEFMKIDKAGRRTPTRY